MGNHNSAPLVYCDPTEQAHGENETAIYRHPAALKQDIFNMTLEFQTLHDIYRKRFGGMPEHNCLGKIKKGGVSWQTNAQVKESAESFGSGLLTRDLCPVVEEWKEKPMRFLGVYAPNSVEYLTADIACSIYGITVAPVYDTLGADAVASCFDQALIPTALVSSAHVEPMMRQKTEKQQYQLLKNLIVIDPQNLQPGLAEKYNNCFVLYTFKEIREAGKFNKKPWAEISRDTVYSFSYTSGTTGAPKTVPITHRNITSVIGSCDDFVHIDENDVYFSYLPLAHVLEKFSMNTLMAHGGAVIVSTGNTRQLKEEISAAKPTILMGVPKVYIRFADAIKKEYEKTNAVVKKLIDRGLNAKLQNLADHAGYTHTLYDRLIFNKARNALGGRLRVMMTGSAPMPPEKLAFLKVVFGVPILEGYGQTEGMGLEFVTRLDDGMGGHVGGPARHNEFKLVDIPDMKYTCKDVDEEGKLLQRGELWVRGPNVASEYYKNPEKSAESFVDGWLVTGDVAEISSSFERRLRIIDRKKNIFKLAQGEYIAPEKLEKVYTKVRDEIEQVMIYGDSNKSAIVAVACIPRDGAKKLSHEFGLELGDNVEEIVKNEEFKKKLLEIFDQAASEAGFNSLERIKGLVVDSKSFTELNLVNDSQKLKRKECEEYYKPEFNKLYETTQ